VNRQIGVDLSSLALRLQYLRCLATGTGVCLCVHKMKLETLIFNTCGCMFPPLTPFICPICPSHLWDRQTVEQLWCEVASVCDAVCRWLSSHWYKSQHHKLVSEFTVSLNSASSVVLVCVFYFLCECDCDVNCVCLSVRYAPETTQDLLQELAQEVPHFQQVCLLTCLVLCCLKMNYKLTSK